MSKKTYRVYNMEDSNRTYHEYDITQEFNDNGHLVTTLSRSNDANWADSAQGENLISFVDTGDFVVFPKKEFAGDVQYDRFAELFILLSFLNKTETYGLYRGRIEEVTPSKTFEI